MHSCTLAIGIHGRGNREEEKKCNFRYNLPHNAERAVRLREHPGALLTVKCWFLHERP